MSVDNKRILLRRGAGVDLNISELSTGEPCFITDEERFLLKGQEDNIVPFLNASEAHKGKFRVFFKKACDAWSVPRLYAYNEYLNNKDNTFLESWEFAKSPYMQQFNETENLYYCDIPSGFTNVIFFCDEEIDGIKYQTKSLKLPPESLYPYLCYFQSSIGYDGIWGDFVYNTITLYIQMPVTESYDPILYYIDGVRWQGYQFRRLSNIDGMNGPLKYYVISIPDKFDSIDLYMKTGLISVLKKDICYNMPVLYLSGEAFKFFDGADDENFYISSTLSRNNIVLYKKLQKVFNEIKPSNVSSGGMYFDIVDGIVDFNACDKIYSLISDTPPTEDNDLTDNIMKMISDEV